jgi:tight adherence protein B
VAAAAGAVSAPELLAFAGGAVGVAAAVRLAGELAPGALVRTSRLVQAAAAAIDALLRLGREGREPGAVERRQLLICGGAAAFSAGTLLAGPFAGALVALGAPLGISRALRARRLAYRRAVERGAPAIALAIADALSGGRSLRGALLGAPATVAGAAGAELGRVRAELATGQSTEAALEALRRRSSSPAIDAIVAASLVHRRSGGNLSALLRRLARSFEDQERLAAEVRVATAQARFTGLLVVALPLAGAVLAELVSPGLVAGLAGSALTAWLVALALALQAGAAGLIRRLGRVRA